MSEFVIASPKWGYGGRMECAWILKSHSGKQITLDFTEFDISNSPKHGLCYSNYVALSNGTHSRKFCHPSDVPKNFSSEGNLLSIKFFSKNFLKWRKFSVKFKTETTGKFQHEEYLACQFYKGKNMNYPSSKLNQYRNSLFAVDSN